MFYYCMIIDFRTKEGIYSLTRTIVEKTIQILPFLYVIFIAEITLGACFQISDTIYLTLFGSQISRGS